MKKNLKIILVSLILVGCTSEIPPSDHQDEQYPNTDDIIERVTVNNFNLLIENEAALENINNGIDFFQVNIAATDSYNRKLTYYNPLFLLRYREEYLITFDVFKENIDNATLYLLDYSGAILFSTNINQGNNQISYNHNNDFSIGTIKLIFELNDYLDTTINLANLHVQRSFNYIEVSVNQVGYLPTSQKIAVFNRYAGDYFKVINHQTGEIVYIGNLYNQAFVAETAEINAFGDFSTLTVPGVYYIRTQFGQISYPFIIGNDIYNTLLIDVFRMITLQRCGYQLLEYYSIGFHREPCHHRLALIYESIYTEYPSFIDVFGGWHDAGDYGRYTLTTTKTINDLLLTYFLFPELFDGNMGLQNSGQGISELVDEALWGLEWLERVRLDWGSVYTAVVTRNFAKIVNPIDDLGQLYVLPQQNTSTASAAATFAFAALVLQDTTPELSERFLYLAIISYEFAILAEGSPFRRNPPGFTAGDYANICESDEIFFAASALYLLTSEPQYLERIRHFVIEHPYNLAGFALDNVSGYGSFILLQDEYFRLNHQELYNDIKERFLWQVGASIWAIESSPLQASVSHYIWGSNKFVANEGIGLLLAYNLTGDIRFYNGAQRQLSYLLGQNRLQQSFVIGYGSRYPLNAHHRPSAVNNILLIGALVGGPDAYADSSLPIAFRYFDTFESYSTNEVAIYYNSALLFLIAGIISGNQ